MLERGDAEPFRDCCASPGRDGHVRDRGGALSGDQRRFRCRVGAVLLVMSVMGVANHMGWEMFPDRLVSGPIGNWIITASHHQRHHERYECNYGLYFRLWDRLCGTDRGLGTFTAEAGAHR